MSSRTYICIPCRTSRRAEAAYGLESGLRCSHCGGPLWELEWRWRIPRKSDDRGWRALKAKVARDTREWLPRRQKLAEGWLAEIDRQIRHVERQVASAIRDRRLRQLKHRRRQILRKSTEPDAAPNSRRAGQSPSSPEIRSPDSLMASCPQKVWDALPQEVRKRYRNVKRAGEAANRGEPGGPEINRTSATTGSAR